MYNKISKLSLQGTIAVISITCSFILMFMLVFVPIPPENEKLFDIMCSAVISTTTTTVFGWLYTQAKSQTKHPPEG